ncbi:hypothetical protein RvY_07068-2 [Ramazzottius varieornatus]|uniref:Biogenesis of lysosome-related organelles complex 1 subunit 2 n=1 Tax=Ramazzottius varieornatus TaxID=947166 RepID=A0A1D1V9E4_RAMVA|nr:hypothetical protein RvY_07068-2 [Ramazzottius varieornatus]
MERRQETAEKIEGHPSEPDRVPAVSDVSEGVDSVFDMEEIQRLYKNLLGRTSEYLKSEFEVTAEDYRLIQEMNNVSTEKYAQLLVTTKNAKTSLKTTNDRFSCIKPFLDRIDLVETQVNELERTIFRLDTYAKQLEARFKAVEKR